MTNSELSFLPAPEDNGKIVTCSITTEAINSGTGLFLKDSRILDVRRRLKVFLLRSLRRVLRSLYYYYYYFHQSNEKVFRFPPPTVDAPIVSLSLGQPLDSGKLMNGSDVYLECDVKANPPVKKVEWFHSVSAEQRKQNRFHALINNKLQDRQLHTTRRIIMSNQTLVLQSITKGSHGQYMCRATNLQGAVSSNDVYLDVKCKLSRRWCCKLMICYSNLATFEFPV